MTQRPVLAVDDTVPAVEDFVRGLQAAIEAPDAELFNRDFAADVLWGSPFGAIVSGYDEIHSIHSRMFAAADRGRSRYEIEHARLVTDDVAIAFVRRLSLSDKPEEQEPQPGRAGTFDELALFVLVQRDGRWWLAAGLHTPDRRDVHH